MLTDWITSSYCSSSNGCVNVRIEPDGIYIRDSKNPAAGVLAFTPTEWDDFIKGAKAGEFDT